MPKISDLFNVVRGKGGYIQEFDSGNVPLVSATSLNNGIATFVNDTPKFKAPAITVERVTGTAFVQLVDFSTVPDDVSVLIPKKTMKLRELYIYASVINNSKWRFSFSRKLIPRRLKSMIVPDLEGKPIHLEDLRYILSESRTDETIVSKVPLTFKEFKITEIFDVERGDFHALSKLKLGNTPTVSRVSYDSGIVGYYDKPSKAKIYPPLTITVSTVTGDAFVQLQSFMATDNVLILLPKIRLAPTTLFFIQIMLNKEKWRCTYGRQLYKEKFKKTRIQIPINQNGHIDEDQMRTLIQKSPYWNLLQSYITSVMSSLPKSTIDSYTS